MLAPIHDPAPTSAGSLRLPSADCCGEAMSCGLVLARLLPRCCLCILICNLRGIKRAQHRSRRGDGAARRSWRPASLGTLTVQPCAGGRDGKIQPGRERRLWRRNKDSKGLCLSAKSLSVEDHDFRQQLRVAGLGSSRMSASSG